MHSDNPEPATEAVVRPTILVVDDEERITEFLAENLTHDDFDVVTAGTLERARAVLRNRCPDAVLLDLGLPDGSGLDLCREIRASDPADHGIHPDIPVLLLTARGEDLDRVRGFERGADDYVVKPFHYPELLLRISAVLRRVSGPAERVVLSAAGISIEPATREVRVHGTPISLANKEFELLCKLASEPRRVFSKEELLEEVWGYRSRGTTRTLDSHASRLRRKLRPLADGRDYIANVWGVGYRLVGGTAVSA